jgi:glycerate kinase
VLVAPQELKGTLTAVEAAEAIARGLRRANPASSLDVAPIADGGPGTIDCLLAARGGATRLARVRDPLGRPVEARWALLPDRTAVVEIAEASGLSRLPPADRSATRTSSYGAGELIRAALDEGCRKVLVGLGGSATSDGGVGAASALGLRFLDANGADLLPGGGALVGLERIELGGRDPRLADVALTAITDVRSPLLGPTGAARMFAPQKGASAADVQLLEDGLARLARLAAVTEGLPRFGAEREGAGAAGGLGFGLAVFLGASLEPGAQALFAALELERRVQAADWVVTGEGRLDAQSLLGKGPVELARLARAHGKKVVAFVGSSELSATPFDQVVLAPATDPSSAVAALEQAAFAWGRTVGVAPG